MPEEFPLAKGAARVALGLGAGASAFLLAWLCAYWFWQAAFRPSPPLPFVRETDPVRLGGDLAGRHVFGDHVRVTANQQPEVASTMTLTGIVSSGDGKPGAAVIAVGGGKPNAIAEGSEILPGITLLRVAPDHVEVSRHGRKVELTLPTKK